MVLNSSSSQDGSTHQIYDSYLNQNRRYVLDIFILEMRSGQGHGDPKWYSTVRHPKMHSHTTFGIPILNNVGDMLRSQLLKKRVQGQNTVTQKWYTTLGHPKMHPHIIFGIPTSNNVGDILKMRSVVKVTVTPNETRNFPIP